MTTILPLRNIISCWILHLVPVLLSKLAQCLLLTVFSFCRLRLYWFKFKIWDWSTSITELKPISLPARFPVFSSKVLNLNLPAVMALFLKYSARILTNCSDYLLKDALYMPLSITLPVALFWWNTASDTNIGLDCFFTLWWEQVWKFLWTFDLRT